MSGVHPLRSAYSLLTHSLRSTGHLFNDGYLDDSACGPDERSWSRRHYSLLSAIIMVSASGVVSLIYSDSLSSRTVEEPVPTKTLDSCVAVESIPLVSNKSH